MLSVLGFREYRLLFFAQAISHIGDQFHLIALPWLVLALTDDPLHLGLVLAVTGVPRAVLMLVGGASADRHSPRVIMLVSDAVRFVLTAGVGLAVLTGTVEVWMVYALALLFGIVSGFSIPAAESMVPRLLPAEALERGNSLMMGSGQLAGFVGPAAAGVLIAAFGTAAGANAETASLIGIGIAFLVDATSFLVSAELLRRMELLRHAGEAHQTHPLSDVVEGVRYAWRHESIRWMVAFIAIANFLVAGPMLVGVPVLARTQLDGGAAALGIVLSAYGLGSLGGLAVAASAPPLPDRAFGWLVVGLMSGFALTLGAIGFVHSTWLAAGLMLFTGLGDGYVGVVLMSSVQRMTDSRYLGRVMSLIMLAVVGLVPASQAAAGAIMSASPTLPFIVASTGFIALAVVACARRASWTLSVAVGVRPEAGVA